MSLEKNWGLDPSEIEQVDKEAAARNSNFVWNADEENNESIAHFFFTGDYQGKQVVYNALIYSLRLSYGAKLYELAEVEAGKHFPDFKPLDPDGETGEEPSYGEEIDEFIASVIYELEEEDVVKVQEYLAIDPDHEDGIGLEVALNEEEVNETVIRKFVDEFRNNTFNLDETLYSFQEDDDEDF